MIALSRTARSTSIGLLVACLLLTSCADGGDSSPESGDAAGDEGGQAPQGRGEVLRAALPTFGTETLSPYIATTATAGDLSLTIFDPIIMIGPDGEPAPGVAEDWEIAEDQGSITLFIREGMEFHNGDPLTAEDVVFSMQAWFDEEVALTQSHPMWPGLRVLGPDDIELVDEYTVRVQTPAGPAETMLRFLAPYESMSGFVVPKNHIEEVGWDEWNRNPIGSGPWSFESHAPGDEFLFRARDDHPFRPVPSFDRLSIVLIPEDGTREAMLRAGEVDIAPIPAEVADDIEALDDVDLITHAATGMSTIMFLGTWLPEEEIGPTADVRVRQAMSLAIDRQEVVDTILRGRGQPVPGSVPGGILTSVDNMEFDDSWDIDQTIYDPDMARDLLEEAGYANGFTFEVYAYQQSAAPPGEMLAEVYAGYWEQIGIETIITPIDNATIEEMASVPGSVQPEVFGKARIHRRRPAFIDETALGRFHWEQSNGESMLGPKGEGHIPDIDDILDQFRHQAGDERASAARELGERLSNLYISPGVIEWDYIWGVGNNAADEWEAPEMLAQISVAYNTVLPR